MRVAKYFLLLLAFAHVVTRVVIAVRSYAFLPLHSPVVTDAYYYFSIARNIVAGFGITHDKSVLTNGFQPLYQFVLVPIFYLAGDSIKAISWALLLGTLCYLITAFVLWRFLKKLFGRWPAMLSASLWIASPVVTKNALNGMETSMALAITMFLVSFYFLQIRQLSPSRISAGLAVGMGGLIGLAFLARVDSAILVLLLAIDYFAVPDHRRWSRKAVQLLLVPVTALLIIGPWMYYSLTRFHSLLPTSGQASRLITEYTTGSSATHVSLDNIGFAVVTGLVKSDPLTGTGYIVLKRLMGGDVPGVVSIVLVALGLVILFALYRLAAKRGYGPMAVVLLIYLGVFILVYSIALPVSWFYERYFAFFSVIFTIAYAAIIEAVLKRWERLRGLLVIVVGVFSIGMLGLHFYYLGKWEPDPRLYPAVEWIKSNTDSQHDRIGIFQAEIIPYYIDNQFVNLDGKCNVNALRALKERRVWTFILEQKLDYIVDRKDVIMSLLWGRSQHIPQNALTLLYEYSKMGQVWQVYRVNKEGGPSG